jgi:hypothetical protein
LRCGGVGRWDRNAAWPEEGTPLLQVLKSSSKRLTWEEKVKFRRWVNDSLN